MKVLESCINFILDAAVVMSSTVWNTFWVDVVICFYGPWNYIVLLEGIRVSCSCYPK